MNKLYIVDKLIEAEIYGNKVNIYRLASGSYYATIWHRLFKSQTISANYSTLHSANIRTIIQAIRLETNRKML